MSRGYEEAYRIAGLVPEDANGHRTEPFPETDYGNAERLVTRHGEDLRYVHKLKKWLVWDGKRWRADDTAEVERRAKETVRSIYHEAANVEDEASRRKLADHAKKSEARTRVEAMISMATSEPGVPVLPDALDADRWLLNVENGTIDLRTGELRDHDRADFITKLAPVEYDSEAEAPTWEAFLERILPSEALRRFVQRVVGYSLTGDVSAQILPFLYGTGANGKSTLINTVLAALGDYGQQAAPELLLAKRGAHPTELADLKGARLVASVEVEDGRKMAESLVKQLTGGERVKARYLHQDFFEFEPTHKIFLAANHKPEILGTDHAIWRRVKLIPFEVTIPDEEQDPHLAEKLREELPGVLAWAVRGCLEWQSESLGEPDEVRDATEEYRAEMDVLADWMHERCVVRPEVWSKFADLYADYEDWCEEAGEDPEKRRKFGARLKERGFLPFKGTDNVAIRRGIALRHDPGPDGDRITQRAPEDGPKGASEAPADASGEDRITERAPYGHSQNACKSEVSKEGITYHYPKNENIDENSLMRRVFENRVMNGNSVILEGESQPPAEASRASSRRLTAEEVQRYKRLVAEGMDCDLARRAVLGEPSGLFDKGG